MIGRFSNLGEYKELLDLKGFIKVIIGGVFALLGYVINSDFGLVLIIISIGINAVPIIIGAIKGLIEKRINVDELVSIAIIASIFAGEFLSAAIVSFVMILGSLIEEACGESARKSIRSLIKIQPQNATLIKNGKEEEKNIKEIKIGDILLVKPGDRIPVDGEILTGITSIDESSITGESIPLHKTRGNEVFSGSLNLNGVITIETNKVGSDTTLGKVIQLVKDAEAHKPEFVTLIDRYANWFTPFILFCSFITWVITKDLNRAITVLIVGCPCALILAAPTAIVATISRAAKSGILIKGGQYIEAIGKTSLIFFDKTGTLTLGEPKIDKIISAKGYDQDFVLQKAASVEQNSTHPLAKAVLNAANYAKLSLSIVDDLVTEIGLGVKGFVDGTLVQVGSAYIAGGSNSISPCLKESLYEIKNQGATPLLVYNNSKSIGIISIFDHIRQNAKETIENLKKFGIKKIGVLSGDHEKSVKRICNSIGTNFMEAGLKPNDKLKIIEEYQGKGHIVTFIGDGINDAPALAKSDIGIAMAGKGTEVALETADIALMTDDISKIPFLIQLSRNMDKIIKFNLFLGIFFNLAAVIISGMGFLSPILGAITHNVGSVLVVFLSASIAFMKEKV